MPSDHRNSQTAENNETGGGAIPRVWMLYDDRPGHRTQVTGLARRLKWPFTEIHLAFNLMNRVPNPLLGASLISLKRPDRLKLQTPYPDLVIGMGRRIVPVARWIRRQSGGRSRIVLLGRKAIGSANDIDLFVNCLHFRQLPHEGLFELVLPPTQVDAESLAAARLARADPIAALRKPRVVLLVGGPTAQHQFDAKQAQSMASQIAGAASYLGGDLAIVTSRRTTVQAVAAMRAAAPGAHIHEWQAGRQDNPFLSYLANADILAVTGESESMIAEAAATGLPLTIVPLEMNPPGLKDRLAEAVRRTAEGQGSMARLCRNIMLAGWIAPLRDVALMHRTMQERGLARIFDGSLNTQPPRHSDEFQRLVGRIEALVSSRRSGVAE